MEEDWERIMSRNLRWEEKALRSIERSITMKEDILKLEGRTSYQKKLRELEFKLDDYIEGLTHREKEEFRKKIIYVKDKFNISNKISSKSLSKSKIEQISRTLISTINQNKSGYMSFKRLAKDSGISEKTIEIVVKESKNLTWRRSGGNWLVYTKSSYIK